MGEVKGIVKTSKDSCWLRLVINEIRWLDIWLSKLKGILEFIEGANIKTTKDSFWFLFDILSKIKGIGKWALGWLLVIF